MVFPALRRAFAGQRARSACSTAAGTTAPGSSGDGLLHAGAGHEAFLKAVPDFERQLVDDGIYLFKYWLCCDQEKQEERFADRLNNPLRRWKLSPVDIKAPLYDAYTERASGCWPRPTPMRPWTLVDFNDQRLGRLTLLRDLLDRLPDTRHRGKKPTSRRGSEPVIAAATVSA
jgi:hypothetical protein